MFQPHFGWGRVASYHWGTAQITRYSTLKQFSGPFNGEAVLIMQLDLIGILYTPLVGIGYAQVTATTVECITPSDPAPPPPPKLHTYLLSRTKL